MAYSKIHHLVQLKTGVGFKSRFFPYKNGHKKIATLGIGGGSARELGTKITKNDETACNKKSIER